MSDINQLQALMQEQKKVVREGRLFPVAARRERLSALLQGIKKWDTPLLEALQADLGKSFFEGYTTEIGIVYQEIREAIRHLPSWSRVRRVRSGMASFPSKGYRIPEPMGMALIFSPWNYPVQLSLAPLTAALAAGCTCV